MSKSVLVVAAHGDDEALEVNGLEMCAPAHSRSLMHVRCHGCCVGVDAAEAFMMIRAIR